MEDFPMHTDWENKCSPGFRQLPGALVTAAAIWGRPQNGKALKPRMKGGAEVHHDEQSTPNLSFTLLGTQHVSWMILMPRSVSMGEHLKKKKLIIWDIFMLTAVKPSLPGLCAQLAAAPVPSAGSPWIRYPRGASPLPCSPWVFHAVITVG